MVRRVLVAIAAVGVVLSAGGSAPVCAQDPKELKELDKLEGYDALPGEKGTKKALENVPNQPVETMIVWSSAAPMSGKAPLTVQFTADPPGGAKTPKYQWQFGDGSTGEGASVSHTYQKAGMYRAILKVSDSSGGLGEDEHRIKVTP